MVKSQRKMDREKGRGRQSCGAAETGTGVQTEMSDESEAVWCLIWIHSLPCRRKIYNDTITIITSPCSHVPKELSALNERVVALINPDRL